MPVDQVIDERQAPYVAAFEQSENIGPPWLREIRRNAMDRFTELGFPTTRNEEWRFTNLAPLTSVSFVRAPELDDSARAVDLIRDLPAAERRLVFINGHYSPELSRFDGRNGVTITSLRAAF